MPLLLHYSHALTTHSGGRTLSGLTETPQWELLDITFRKCSVNTQELTTLNIPLKIPEIKYLHQLHGKNYFVKIVNAGTEPVIIESISCEEKELSIKNTKLMQIYGKSLNDVNVLGQNEKIFIEEINCEKSVELKPLSCSVLIV